MSSVTFPNTGINNPKLTAFNQQMGALKIRMQNAKSNSEIEQIKAEAELAKQNALQLAGESQEFIFQDVTSLLQFQPNLENLKEKAENLEMNAALFTKGQGSNKKKSCFPQMIAVAGLIVGIVLVALGITALLASSMLGLGIALVVVGGVASIVSVAAICAIAKKNAKKGAIAN